MMLTSLASQVQLQHAGMTCCLPIAAMQAEGESPSSPPGVGQPASTLRSQADVTCIAF